MVMESRRIHKFRWLNCEILDGGPNDVEKDIDFWFNNTSDDDNSGLIGFWGYTILREVQPSEIVK